MSVIRLDSEYSIQTDANNFSLLFSREKEVTKKGITKTVVESDAWYNPSLELSLKTYLRESLRECESIEHVLKKIDEVHATIKELKKNVPV